MSKPTIYPMWSENNNPVDNIEPIELFKLSGIQSGNAWGREHLNWQFYAIYQWVNWVKNDASDKTLNLSDLASASAALINLGLQNPATGIAASTSGNAATATKLLTKRKINGVDFDGTSDITITAAPNSHTHGSLTNDGKIGTTPHLPLITGAGGSVIAGSFGSTANTFAQGNDSRLSNSREWSADTISKVEAEGGTDESRRAWTSLRVRQSVVAWWNSITGLFGRDLVTSSTAASARAKLELGAAATKGVGLGAGQLLESGSYGSNLHSSVLVDLNLLPSIYNYSGRVPVLINNENFGDSPNSPRINAYGHVEQDFYIAGGDGSHGSQNVTQRWIGYRVSDGFFARSRFNGVWTPWVEFLHSGNLYAITGSSTTHAMTQKAVTDAINTKANAIVFSTAFPITTSTNHITWWHGKGTYPKFVEVGMQCVSPELGYAVGDRVSNFAVDDKDGWTTTPSVASNSSKIWWAKGDSVIAVINNIQTKYADYEPITLSKWQLYFRAIF